jgi:hypothetical protein
MSLTRTLRQKLPFLRYSFLRRALGGLNVMRTDQMGDGREDAMADHVIANAPPSHPRATGRLHDGLGSSQACSRVTSRMTLTGLVVPSRVIPYSLGDTTTVAV